MGAFFIKHGSFGHTWMYFGMLGGLAFNMILFFVLLLAVLRWRGFI